MMVRPLVRALAVTVLLAQLAPVPAAVACTLRHRSPAQSCEREHRASGPAVAAPGVGTIAMCAVLPCVTPGSDATPVTSAVAPAPSLHAAVIGAPASVPASFAAAPIPPPPEA